MSDEPETINVSYTNWRGETSVRRVILGNLRFGTTEWHEEPTWLISAFDLDHPAQIWKEFDLTKCDFNRNLSRATPTREQIMADERVQALVEAGRNCRSFTAIFAGGDESMILALREWDAALAALTETGNE